MNISFGPSNAGVDAQSIGAGTPECGPKSAPVLDHQTGYWSCAGTQGAGLGGGSEVMLAGLAALAYWWFVMRGKSTGGVNV